MVSNKGDAAKKESVVVDQLFLVGELRNNQNNRRNKSEQQQTYRASQINDQNLKQWQGGLQIDGIRGCAGW